MIDSTLASGRHRAPRKRTRRLPRRGGQPDVEVASLRPQHVMHRTWTQADAVAATPRDSRAGARSWIEPFPKRCPLLVSDQHAVRLIGKIVEGRSGVIEEGIDEDQDHG